MTKETWSINELSKEFDITTRSIRFYEDEGLVSPTRRGQTRIYSRQDRTRLKLILRGKRLGFSLAEIAELLSLYDPSGKNSDTQLKTMIKKVHDKQAVLNQQLLDLQIVQEELAAAEQRCWEALSEDCRRDFAEELKNTQP